MSKEIQTEISIEGKMITRFSSIVIAQQFNCHHTFSITVNHELFEEFGGHHMQSSQNYIGKRITISFGEKSTTDTIFKGVITEVGMQHTHGLWGNIILKGYSPTYLMEGGLHNNSYYKKSLDVIVKDIAAKLSVHDMKLSIKPKFTKAINYICQYKESNFNFVNWLAAQYGEWFYYDGEELFFGKPDKVKKVELLYGEHIDDMCFSMRVIPEKATYYSYNSSGNNVNTAVTPGSADCSNEYVRKALSASDELFKNSVLQSSEIRTEDKQQLDLYAKKQKGLQAAGTVVLKAQGDNPKVKLGCRIDLKVAQKETKGKETLAHGEYLVTDITHQISGIGEYMHTFEAIPADNNYIPATAEKPLAETQMAIVKDNNDPEKMGRVRVQMLWQEKKGELTDWIRVLTPDAGSSNTVNKNRGFVFIPEIEDQVLIGFRYNDPNRPFVMGSIFHGSIARGGGHENTSKTIQTRSGHRIELNDDKNREFIVIKDKKGNHVKIDTAGETITISALKDIHLNAGENFKITAGKNISVSAGEDIHQSAIQNVSLIAGKDMSLNASGDITEISDNRLDFVRQNFSRESTTSDEFANEISLFSQKEDLTMQSSKTININSAEKSKLF